MKSSLASSPRSSSGMRPSASACRPFAFDAAVAATLCAALGLCCGPAPAAETPFDLTSREAPPNAVWVETLDLANMAQDYGSPRAGKTVDGNPLKLSGKVYPHGIGTHARSEMLIELDGCATRFIAMAGLDDERKGFGSISFTVLVDGKKAIETPVLHGGDSPVLISVDLTGKRRIALLVEDGGDNINHDHADWAGAVLLLAEGTARRPKAVAAPQDPPPPIASGASPVPAIHGPRVVGSTPGRPFLFLIPATGDGPLEFSARNLPPGLSLDSRTGIVTGSLREPGETVVDLEVKGPRGSAKRKLTIVGGEHKLCLTPPMGWNSWNVWAGAIDDEKVRQAADWMVKSGLAAHGFQYINIDDTWEGSRAASGEIQTNDKFPDMKALADYVHSRGLKLGIYSSPGPKTCANFEGSFGHEQQDAASYARWGIDYLKHDWCSCQSKDLKEPYRIMRAALDAVDRDIVYSLCQYGMGNVWDWGAEVGGNCWRTTGDITDSWGSMSSIGFGQNGHEAGASPGHWNDPDMLVVGKVGWGPSLHPTRLSPNEQITHITLWCLLASPLLIGCDLSQLDKFTLDLLTNDEVIEVNQDPLGKQAARRSEGGQLEVWSRQLWDGTTAVGLFNRSSAREDVTARWQDLGLSGPQSVRDLWGQKDLGTFVNSFAASVPTHGAVLVKIGTPKGE